MRDYSILPNGGHGICDKPVDKGFMTYPCRLPAGHESNDGEPCLAPEVAKSIRLHEAWEEKTTKSALEGLTSGTAITPEGDHIHWDVKDDQQIPEGTTVVQQDEWKPPLTRFSQELIDQVKEQADVQIVQDLLRHFGVTASTEATRQAISSLQRTRHERAVQGSPEVPHDEPRRTTLLEDITKVIHECQEEPPVEIARYVIEIVTARLREGM